MVTRRQVLALTGSLSLAGCLTGNGGTEPVETDVPETDTSTPKPTPADTPTETETPEETTPELSEREQAIRQGIPLNGLGAYEDQMLEAGPVQEATAKEIKNILESSNTPQQEADKLSQKLTDENFGTWMAEYHRQNDDPENSVVVNENYGFFQDSGPIVEIYTVEGGELQSGPILSHTSYNKTSTHKPGDGPNPQYLHDMRDNTDAAQYIAQDYPSIVSGIERGIRTNDATQEEVEEYRARILNDWSRVMFGVDDEPEVRPYDLDTANIVFEAIHGDGNAQIIADLTNEYHSEEFNPETLVEVEYDGGWNFYTPEDREEEREMGDPLQGEEADYFE